MTIAIDGPAGTGKSTVARKVAIETGACYLSSGMFYRAITHEVLQKQIGLDDWNAITNLARSLSLDMTDDQLLVNGIPRHEELRTPEVDAAVAQLSAIEDVRKVVDTHLRRIAAEQDIVIEGRDMTTVVFPDAEVKVYLDASIEARARRRFQEQGGSGTLDEVRSAIAERDQIDTTKPVGRLIVDPSALYIDTSHLTVGQVCEIVLRTILSHKNQNTGAIGQS